MNVWIYLYLKYQMKNTKFIKINLLWSNQNRFSLGKNALNLFAKEKFFARYWKLP